MRKYLFLLAGLFIISSANAQYDIQVKINGLNCGEEILLANHFGDKQYLRDTAECSNGIYHFKGDKTLENGVYLVVLPKKNYFEIMISKAEDQTKLYFETDTLLTASKMISRNSEENALFFEFNKLASKLGTEASRLQKEMKDETDEKKIEKIKETLKGYGEQIANRRIDIAKNNLDKFIGKLYKAMIEVPDIEAPDTMDEKESDRYRYLWMRAHFWDNLDKSEDGIVRSPVFHNKIKDFFENYIPPMPDTAIMLIDNFIKQIEDAGSKEQFKYAVHYFLSNSEKSKYMCFDKVLHHMATEYYCAGKAFWADSAFLDKICSEADKMALTLCEVVAPDMAMPDSTFSKRVVMSEIDKPVTILVFWDINCGHCKKEMPLINQYYDTANRDYVEIYSVYTQGDWEGWKKRIREEGYKFINVANAFGDDDFRKHYNIRSTPQIYILDQDKKIRFKKIAVKDFAKIVKFLLKEQGIIQDEE